MENNIPQIYFFLAKYTYILIALVCALIRWAHMCKPYDENEEYFYPARKLVYFTFFLSIFEFPYLLNINSLDALIYVQMFGLLVFPPASFLIFKRYFFFYSPKLKTIVLLIGPLVPLLPLFFIAIQGKNILSDYKSLIWIVIGSIFVIQMFLIFRLTRQLLLEIRKFAEMSYSDESDFPVIFAKTWLFIPYILCVLMLIVALIGTQEAMVFRDLIVSGVFLFLTISILYPHRHNTSQSQDNIDDEDLQQNINILIEENYKNLLIRQDSIDKKKRVTCRLQEEQRLLLEQQIVDLVISEELFKKNNLKLDDLLRYLNTNRSYVSEAISLGNYGSFYKMINQLRIEYCLKVLKDNPNIKLEDLAYDSGFSSRTTFWRAFKRVTGINASQWNNLS